MTAKRKIRDTDIVYSAATLDGDVRLALSPLLDSEPLQHKAKLKCRAVWTLSKKALFVSCRSPGVRHCAATNEWSGPAYHLPWRDAEDDIWLDWLAEGEGR